MSSLKKPQTILAAAISLFVILKILLLSSHRLLFWDEAVYVNMGRFVWTLGESGMWEILRPPIMPVILSGAQLTGNFVLYGSVVVSLAAIASSLLVYLLLAKKTDGYVAALSATLPMFFALSFEYSSYLLTGYLCSTFILAAAYTYSKQRHVWTGILVSLAFLTRFPAGLAIAGFAAVYLYETVRSYLRQKTLWNKKADDLLAFSAPIILIIGSWMAMNWSFWGDETQYWWHAALRPLLYGGSNVFTQNLSMYDHSYLYYVKRLLYFLPLSLLALAAPIKKNKDLLPLAITTALLLLFFSQITNQQWRFVLPILPGVFVFMALGAQRLMSGRTDRLRQAFILVLALIIVANAASGVVTAFDQNQNQDLKQAYEFLNNNPVAGPVIVNDPVFGAYIDNKLIPLYYEALPRFSETLKQEHDAVVFVPENFPCYDEQEECEEQLRHVIDVLTTEEKLLFAKEIAGKNYYIFSDQEWFQGLSTASLRAKYGLGDLITLSNHPQDRFPLSIILEDFPSVDDKTGGLWQKQQALEVLSLVQDLPVTVAAIPTHHRQLLDEHEQLIRNLSSFEIAQNGFDHTGMPGTDQRGRMQQGRYMLQNIHSKQPTTFIAPYYSADSQTSQALSELGYKTYVSTPGDATDVQMQRLDQTLTLISNWENNEHKSAQELIAELEDSQRFNRYALTSIYYFTYDNESLQQLNRTLSYARENLSILSVDELSDWMNDRSEASLQVRGSSITIQAPEDMQGLTLLFRSQGEYELQSPVDVYVKNAAAENLNLCINSVCETVAPGHFFLSKSPMVKAPEDEESRDEN